MSNQSSQWIKILSTEGNIRGVAIQATELIQELVQQHQLKGVHAQTLGEAVVGGLLLASHCKGSQRVNLNIRGTGVCTQALVDAYPDGTVRGYVVPRDPSLAQRGDGEHGGHWGTGLLSVLRTSEAEDTSRQPYIGTVPLLTGNLAKDLTFYWVQSEQIPSAVGIAVSYDAKGKITAAGGFLVQVLPGATQDEIQRVERHINEIQSLAKSISENESPMALLGQIFQSQAFVIVEEKPLQFRCTCSEARVTRALALVGAEELQDMLERDGHATVTCDFCAQNYRISGERLKEMIATAR